MKLAVNFAEKGILFSLQECARPSFPVNQKEAKKLSNEDWNRVNEAELLWYDGLLTPTETEGQYLLRAENYYTLNAESKELLQLPPEDASLGITEIGHVMSHQYGFEWFAIHRGRSRRNQHRQGMMLSIEGKYHTLSQSQLALVELIDQYVDVADKIERGLFHAQVVQLAKQANAKIDDFTLDRQFVLAQDADYIMEATSPKEIIIRPTLKDVENDIVAALPKQLKSRNSVLVNGRHTHVFATTKAQETYQKIESIPAITGTNVPEFLENPAAILPENFDFFSDEFSQRVKGLKIRTSSTGPFLNVEESTEKPGWFDIDTGLRLHSDIVSEDETMLEELPMTPELQQLIDTAIQGDERFIYYQDQWVKIDPIVQEKLQQVNEIMGGTGQNAVSPEQCGLILNIYENLSCVEYNEGALLSHDGKAYPNYEMPDAFHGTPYPHQKEGYVFLRTHYDHVTGTLLADDMGLGKTVQVIAFLAHLFETDALATALLVMPKSLLENWESELRLFLPSAKKIYIHQGPHRYHDMEMITQYEIVLTTYETLAIDQMILGRITWSCIICDEVQKIKNFQTIAAHAVKGMNSKCRIAMTGTPVENRLSELWSIADFVQPGLLGSYTGFRKAYERPIKEGGVLGDQAADKLVDVLSPIFLRRTKEGVLSDQLPEKTEETIHLQIDKHSLDLYMNLMRELQESENPMPLAAIQKLIMLLSHPRLIESNTGKSYTTKQLIAQSPKLKWTIEKLKTIKAKKEKVIIFTKYKKMQSMLRYVLFDQFGIDALIVNGDVTADRLKLINHFSKSEGFQVIILSPKAAGVGLTITAANHVIHYTREWNPAVENQATERAYRIGQKKPVFVYYPVLVTKAFLSAEEKLSQLLEEKRDLMKRVIITANLKIDMEDLQDILSLH